MLPTVDGRRLAEAAGPGESPPPRGTPATPAARRWGTTTATTTTAAARSPNVVFIVVGARTVVCRSTLCCYVRHRSTDECRLHGAR